MQIKGQFRREEETCLEGKKQRNYIQTLHRGNHLPECVSVDGTKLATFSAYWFLQEGMEKSIQNPWK